MAKQPLDLKTADAASPAAPAAGSAQVDAFLKDVDAAVTVTGQKEPSKLIFALDATMSRAPTWALARKLQGDMFVAADAVGSLAVQIVFFRGQFELRKSAWTTSPATLADKMARVRCQAGATQIRRVLSHVAKAAAAHDIKAAVYVGDAVEEHPGALYDLAAQLGLLGVKLFIFQEGADGHVERIMKELARLSGGAYAQFDQSSAERLKTLLEAVGAYAAGGHMALEQLATSNQQAAALLAQLPPSAGK